MATTVTYKGQVLVTVDNSTKVLETSGTWCEDDFTLTDVSGGGTGEWTTDGIATNAEPNGAIALDDSITSVPQYAFARKPITRISANYVTNIAQYAFYYAGLTRIEETDLPRLTSLHGAFESCGSLEYVKLTTAINGYAYAFRNCSNLKEAYFPNATANFDRGCQNCGKLEIIDCGSSNITNTNCFQNCKSLRTMILRKSSVQTLQAWTANCMGGIYNNPTESTVYVPQSLISSYQTASNWSSAYSAGVTFSAIEGSIYEI